MVIISKSTLKIFGEKHKDSIDSINHWYEIVKGENWSSFSEVKNTFNSVDYVGNDRYVFNIKGNKYRLVALIFFDRRTLFIRFIGKHSDYDRIDCSKI